MFYWIVRKMQIDLHSLYSIHTYIHTCGAYHISQIFCLKFFVGKVAFKYFSGLEL